MGVSALRVTILRARAWMTECSLQPTPLAMLGHRWRPVRGSALSELACGQGFDLRYAPRLRRGRRDEERPEQSATPAARRTKNVRQRWVK